MTIAINEARMIQIDLKIISPGTSVTYQSQKINKCLFILNCLLVQIFYALCKIDDASNPHEKICLWASMITIIMSVTICQFPIGQFS